MLVNGGLDKFFHYMPVPADLPPELVTVWKAFLQIGWLMPLVGSIELIGGLLLIIPRTRALGAIVLLPVVVGILLTNTITEPSGMPIAIALFAIELWVIYENREKYLPMIR
jgi:uncharacterized membrane protein YphA (DoxX/SURF4 family)